MTENASQPIRAETEIEVRYAETDQMGVVHHANYVVWFELARTRLCRESGFHYADVERLGYLLMVTGVEARYYRPARYGDVVQVACWCERMGSRGLRFAYEVQARGNAWPPGPPSTSGSRGRPAAPAALRRRSAPPSSASPESRLLSSSPWNPNGATT